MKTIRIELDINNDIYKVIVEDENNYIEHDMFLENNEEKNIYLDMTVKDFIKDYICYYNDNKEKVEI